MRVISMRLLRRLLIAATVLLGFAFLAPAVEAANCFRGVGGAFVCDARRQPVVFTAPEYRPNSILFNRTYAWLADHTPTYKEPRPGAEIATEGTVGLLFYTIEDTVIDEAGNKWYKVADNEYARAEDMVPYTPTRSTGLRINSQPERPFGWVMTKFQPASGPDQQPPENAPWVERYTFIEIFGAARGEEGWIWFDIGNGQWVKQTNLAIVDVKPRPEGVGENEFWVEVDLFEEVFAAYEGDRMVYAGLVSSGLEGAETNEGLFTVYSRHREWPMWGGTVGKNYYYLQDVPHTMFYDGEIALHGAYWHDGFGAPRSNGCVNMMPRDAEWVFHWSENAPNEKDLWVWVHTSPQDYFLQEYGNSLAALSMPPVLGR